MRPYPSIIILSVLFLSCLLFSQGILAQETSTRNIPALEKILEQQIEQKKLNQQRIEAYLKKKENREHHKKFTALKYYLENVTDSGMPIYKAATNAESFSSLGGTSVTSMGDFGLDLGGANLNVIIWDSGVSRRTHQEFGGRVLRQDVGAEDDHATHVAGTLLASGINSRAKGFLPLATAKTYDFGDDGIEVTNELMNGDIQVSNHSYSLVLGWDQGQWIGDAAISEDESYLFGFYNSSASVFDQILFNAPFYCIVKAAGNDRGDSGDSSRPPDGPYDIISDFGLSKNTFTIGAVVKLQAPYSSREDIVMSSFSSWGPTDDGRIKPDFVAPGVNLFSPLSESDQDYGNLSGTSMASPSAAGAIGLINEAYFSFNQRYMRSATMKALLAQTALDAGLAEGPDYQFGWGMISIENAVDLILREDASSVLIAEENLQQGEVWEMELNPTENSDLTVTIAWTDPAGTPVAPALDPPDLMLVNDLDMRIVDDEGNEVFPYILNPANPPGAATTGDNFRDNIEKIEFTFTEPKTYFLRISHKGGLENGNQDFSLILDYDSQRAGVSNLYWVDDSGDFTDVTHWSNTSGGTGTLVPDVNSKLIIDNNSFNSNQNVITLTDNITVFGLVALTDNDFILDLNGNTLGIASSFFAANSNYTIRNGTLRFESTNPNGSFSVDLNTTNLENVDIEISNTNSATWLIDGDTFSPKSITVNGGNLFITESNLIMESFSCVESNCEIVNSNLVNLHTFNIHDAIFKDDDQTSYVFSGDRFLTIIIENNSILGSMTISGANGAITMMEGSINELLLTMANLEFTSNINIGNLIISNQSGLTLQDGVNLTVSDAVLNLGTGSTLMSPGNADLTIAQHSSFCFEDLTISNVDLIGSSSVSVGVNSSVTNASGWQEVLCNNLLFADFEVQDDCVFGLTALESRSTGSIASTNWYVDDIFISSETNTLYTFTDTLPHDVRIEVTDQANQTLSWESQVIPQSTSLDSNFIIQNSTSLVSFQLADRYEWYRNNILIPNSNVRVLPYNGEEALFYVLTFDDMCNRKSVELDFTNAIINIDANGSDIFKIAPNPASEVIRIDWSGQNIDIQNIQIIGIEGQVHHWERFIQGERIELPVNQLSTGIYLLKIITEEDIFLKKIVVDHTR